MQSFQHVLVRIGYKLDEYRGNTLRPYTMAAGRGCSRQDCRPVLLAVLAHEGVLQHLLSQAQLQGTAKGACTVHFLRWCRRTIRGGCMAIVQGRAIRPRSTDGGVGGVPAAPPAVGCVHEDALCCVLHHMGLDLLHDLALAEYTLATAHRMLINTNINRKPSMRDLLWAWEYCACVSKPIEPRSVKLDRQHQVGNMNT